MNKRRIFILSAAVLILAFGGLFFGLKQAASPEKVVDTFKEAVQKDDPSMLQELIVPDDKQAELSRSSIQAMISYLKENASSYEAIVEGLEQQVEENDYAASAQQISLTEEGKKWGVFSDYKLKAKTAVIKLTGQNETDTISLTAGESKRPIKQLENEQYGPVLPGTYTLNVTVNNELGTFKAEEKKEVWGSPEVSVVINSSALASADKGVQQAVITALDTLNRDLAVYQTSGYDKSKLTNVTNEIREETAFLQESFTLLQDYLDEIHVQYKGAVINLDDLGVHYFDGKWSADATALVAFDNKLKYRDLQGFEDHSIRSLVTYSLFYDKEEKKWLIDGMQEREPVGSEETYWENKKELKVENPPVLKWQREGAEGVKL